jgi:hypothetical protein
MLITLAHVSLETDPIEVKHHPLCIILFLGKNYRDKLPFTFSLRNMIFFLADMSQGQGQAPTGQDQDQVTGMVCLESELQDGQ